MKKMLLTLLVLLVATAALSVDSASAEPLTSMSGWQTVRLGGGMMISPSSTESLVLNGSYYIKNLVIQAEGSGGSSAVEVMVNGQVKGTIYAPGRDPSYVVTVEETARSIEFRHRDGGTLQVTSVMGTVTSVRGRPGLQSGAGRFGGSHDDLVGLANRALREIDHLSVYADPTDEITYLFPIKRNAGLVYVMATSHGDFSRQTTSQLVALSDQITYADAYLNRLMLLDGAFESVVELLSVKESIRSLLQ